MSFWSANKLTTANLDRISPICDAYVGTDGYTTDINQAVADGHKKIILLTGAILTGNLDLSANDGYLVAIGNRRSLALGSYTLTVSGDRWYISAFNINAPAGNCITVAAGAADLWLDNLDLTGAGAHGIEVVNSSHILMTMIRAKSCVGDAVRCGASTAHNTLTFSHCYSNTGYGFNDLADANLVYGNDLTSNTAGAINGTPAVNVGNET